MTSYRQRTDECWKLFALQLLSAGIVGSLGVWITFHHDVSLGVLPISTFILGTFIGGTITGMSYLKAIEDAYDRLPVIFLMILGGFLIMYLITEETLAGLSLGFGAGILITLILGEISIRV